MSKANKQMGFKKEKKWLRLTFFSIFLGFVVISSFFIIDETQFGVVTRFGRPLSYVRTPGLNVKFPWPIDKAIPLDKRLLFLDLPAQSLLTFDEKNVEIDAFMTWRIIDPILFAATMQNRQIAESRLSDIGLAQIAIAVGETPFNGFINLEASNIEIHNLLQQATKGVSEIVSNFGITVEDIGITSFLVPAQNRMSVIQRMQAERGRIAAVYRSLGVEEALTIEGQAAAEHEKILGQAHATGIAIRGDGEAQALKILGEAYDKDPQFYRFIRSLESYEAIIGKQSTVFLEADSPLLKYFNGAAINAIQSNMVAEKK